MLIVPRRLVSSYDTDAQNYITAVEAADGQSLEAAVKDAIDTFITGCKADGTWSAIRASCILAGARTLAGALVPLVGAAPTNTNSNFVSGDYNRKTGLKGGTATGASAKRLNSNRLATADGLNDFHLCAYQTLVDSGSGFPHLIGAGYAEYGIGTRSADTKAFFFRSKSNVTSNIGSSVTGFVGMSRASGSSYTARFNNANQTLSVSTTSASALNVNVFSDSGNSFSYNGRLSFYSIGSSLTLASLNARLVTLMAALSAAIP
jgi:hypothetical protein